LIPAGFCRAILKIPPWWRDFLLPDCAEFDASAGRLSGFAGRKSRHVPLSDAILNQAVKIGVQISGHTQKIQ
jgi:hypothetical protein